LPRIRLPEPETMSEAQRRVYDEIVRGPRGGVVGPLLAALLNPELADRWQKLGEQLRYHTSIRARHTELAILVTARACNCALEWHVHEPWARRAGLGPDVLEMIKKGDRPCFVDPLDQATHDFASELQKTRTVSEETYGKVLQHYEALGVVELTAVVGYYTMVAMTLNAHDMGIPDGEPNPFA
jgi:4-carboxymuconolactone decarboxylase